MGSLFVIGVLSVGLSSEDPFFSFPLDIGGSFVGSIRRPMGEDGCKMAGEVRGAAVGRV